MPYDVPVDNEYLGLVAARNAFIVPTLGMVTRREPFRRPVYEDPFFQEQVPEEVVAMLRNAAAGDSGAAPLRTAADEARARVTTLEDHKRLLAAGARRFIHMPYDVPVDNEYLGLVAARNAFIVPTLGMVTRREPFRRPVYEDPFFQEQVPEEVVAMLRNAAAGDSGAAPLRTAADEARARVIRGNFVRLRDHVVLGTDAGAVGDFFGYADHLELELFVRLGMTPAEAIVAATTRAARAFGLTETGSIEAGRSADFLVLDANPLDDIMHTRQITAVYLRGVEVDRGALRARWTD